MSSRVSSERVLQPHRLCEEEERKYETLHRLQTAECKNDCLNIIILDLNKKIEDRLAAIYGQGPFKGTPYLVREKKATLANKTHYDTCSLKTEMHLVLTGNRA